MIGNISYEDINKVVGTLNTSLTTIEKIINDNHITGLEDFLSTASGYAKYLETTVKLYKDADFAIADLNKKN